MNKRIFRSTVLILAVLMTVLAIPGSWLRGTAYAASDSDITIQTLRTTVRTGASKNDAGDYVWDADHSHANHRFTFRVTYAVSGTNELDPESFRIVIPKSILVNRSGQPSDYYDMSLPREDASGLSDGNLFVYKEDGNNLVIYNRIKISAAQNGYFEVSYLTSERTFAYADYGTTGSKNPKGGSDPFKAVLTVTQGNLVKTKESEKVSVYINTSAKITSTSKAYPTFYRTWQPEWGSRPADADKWLYLVWEVKTIIPDATQPYNFTIEDDFSPYGEVVAYKFTGTGEYTTNKTAANQESSSSYGRYDYVLTRHDKDKYTKLAYLEDQYTVRNTVTTVADPVDQVDADTNANAARDWTFAVHKWKRPRGHFYMWKFGQDSRDRIVFNSENIRRYNLDEFIEGKTDIIEDLAYYTYVHGDPYPWTLLPGANPDDHAAYGKGSITWVLEDNDFNLRAINGNYLGESEDPAQNTGKTRLDKDDYRLDYIILNFIAEGANYIDDTKSFESSAPIFSEHEEVIVYAESGSSGEFIEAARWKPLTKEWNITNPSLASAAEGMKLTFNNTETNCTGYKLLTVNSHYYTRLGAYPHITLLASPTVKQITNNLTEEPKIAVRNIAHSHVYQGAIEGENHLISFTRDGVDYVNGIIRKGEVTKQVTGYANDPVRREYTITWNIDANETYLTDGDVRAPITQASGVFYDLLPQGANFKTGSLVAYADYARLSSGKYEVETILNYKNSGRTLLKVSFNQAANRYAFSYSTVHSWNMIEAYGEQVLNSVAYETGNPDIGEGRPDDGGTGTDRDLLRDLDPETDAEKFLYAQDNHNINIIHAASLGLSKKVLTGQNSVYSNNAITSQDSDYVYALHFSTDSHTKASNLILFDSLENYVIASGENAGAASDWHGKLTAVDVSQPSALGIVPVVYYSTAQNLDIRSLNVGPDYNFAASRTWTKAEDFGTDLSSVRAVAIDLRHLSDGTVFELQPEKSVMVRLFMRSPESVVTDKIEPMAYNNVWLHNTHTDVTSGTSESEMIHQDYTRISFRITADLPLSKVDSTDPEVKVEDIVFHLYGTSDYGTDVDEYRTSNENGNLRFENIERGTYILQEVDGVRDYLQDHTERAVVINPDGTVTLDGNNVSGPVELRNDPRIHGDLRLEKRGTLDGHHGTVALEGSTFLLEGVSDYGNEIEKYAVSDSAGTVLFEDVELGTYELTEVQAAEGYILSRKTWQAVCDMTGFVTLYDRDENGNWVEAALDSQGNPLIINEPLHKLLLKKYDEVNPTHFLPGAEFRLNGTSDYGTITDLTVETDQFGTAHFEGLEAGSYVLRETKAPKNYEPDEQDRLVTVNADGTVTVYGLSFLEGDFAGYVGFPNARKYEGVVTITKRWDDNNAANRPIPVVHLDTEEKTFTGPTATIDREKWMPFCDEVLRWAATFTRDTTKTLSEVQALTPSLEPPHFSVARVDDETTDYSIYVWMGEDLNAFWWSDAEIVFFPENCEYMFSGLRRLTELDLEDFNTSKVKNMSGMFRDSMLLETLKISGWDTSHVTKMDMMFYELMNLKNLEINSWDISNVTTLSYAFYEAPSAFYLNPNLYPETMKTLDLSSWNTANVTDLSYIFCGSGFEEIHISGWDVSNVTDMQSAFLDTNKLKELDLSGWDTSSVKNMKQMFDHSNVKNVYVSTKWSTENVTESDNMFNVSSYIKGEQGTAWDNSNPTDKTYAKIDGGPSDPGYFWYKEAPQVTGHALTPADIMGSASEAKMTVPASAEMAQSFPKDGTEGNGPIDIHQVTNSSLWTPTSAGQDSSQVFDQWVDNGNGTWTYRFRVFDQDSEYHVWEENIPGYTSENMEGIHEAQSITLMYKAGGIQNPDPLVITNKKTSDDPNPAYGSLVIRKAVTGSVPAADHGREFTLRLTLNGASGRFGAYDFTDGQSTELKLRDGETVTLSGIPTGTTYTVSEDVPEGYNVSYEGAVSGSISQTVSYVTVTNEAQYGSLTIKKTLSAANGAELTHADKTRKFAFDIELSAADFNGVHGGLVFTNGKATAWLTADETLTIDGLPIGTPCIITEQKQTGFVVTPAEFSGTITKEGANAAFNNEVQPREMGTLKLSKTAPENHDESFAFHLHFTGLQSSTEYDYTVNDVEKLFISDGAGRAYVSLKLNNGESAVFTELPKDAKVTIAEDANEYIASYSVNGAAEVENRQPDTTLSTEALIIVPDNITLVNFTNVSQEFPVAIRKQGSDGAYLEGAELCVLDAANEEEIARWTTESEEHIIALPAGIYLLRELKAPDGYGKAADVRFSITREGLVTIEDAEDDYVYFVGLVNTLLPVYDLSLSKEVGGAYGSTEQYFRMTVSLSELPDGLYPIDLTKADRLIPADEFDSLPHSNPESVVIAGGSGTAELWLKHGQQITVKSLPQNAIVNINEDAALYTASWKTAGGQTAAGSSTGDLIVEKDLAITFTNTLDHEMISISGTKIWDDNDNQANSRPDSITIRLFADLADTGKSVTLSEQSGWDWTFTDLDKYANGSPISYTVAEDPVPDGYNASITGDAEQGFVVTNTLTEEPPTPHIFFRINEELPKTGLTAAPSLKPAAVDYRRTKMELLIPSLNVTSEIVTVDFIDNEYPVEWLGMNAGLLSDTALPGKGISVIAAHNTLNKEEYGPFARLSMLEPGDRFFVRTNNELKGFTVYANEKIDAADTAALADIASRYESTVTLLTCEDERSEGGYASRRIVAAAEN